MMDEARAREILGDNILADNLLYSAGVQGYLGWNGGDVASIDIDYCTAETIEAIAWWMRNKGVK